MHEPYSELARRLNAITLGNFIKRRMLANGGAEEIQNIIKIAPYVTGRSAIGAFKDAFHDRNLLAKLCYVNLGSETEGLWRTSNPNKTWERQRDLPGF